MQKSIIFFSLSTMCYLFAACGNSNTTTPTPQEEDVQLETIQEKDDSGRVYHEYQVDKKTQKKHGKETFTLNGKIFKEVTYKLGVPVGKEIQYHDNGKVMAELPYANGRYEGQFKYFFADGTLHQDGMYVANNIEGDLKTYYPNGQLKEIVAFKNSLENGAFIEYYENGKLKAKGAYLTDNQGTAVENGALEEYDSTGTLVRKADCEMGNCYTTWDIKKGDVKPKKIPK